MVNQHNFNFIKGIKGPGTQFPVLKNELKACQKCFCNKYSNVYDDVTDFEICGYHKNTEI